MDDLNDLANVVRAREAEVYRPTHVVYARRVAGTRPPASSVFLQTCGGIFLLAMIAVGGYWCYIQYNQQRAVQTVANDVHQIFVSARESADEEKAKLAAEDAWPLDRVARVNLQRSYGNSVWVRVSNATGRQLSDVAFRVLVDDQPCGSCDFTVPVPPHAERLELIDFGEQGRFINGLRGGLTATIVNVSR